VVREDLLAPSVIATVQASARTAVKALMSGKGDGHASPTRQAELKAEIARLVDAVAQVGMSEALRERLQSAEKELARITAAAAPRGELNADRITKQAVAAYKRRLLDLVSALQDEGMDRDRTRALLADILGPVKGRPGPQLTFPGSSHLLGTHPGTPTLGGPWAFSTGRKTAARCRCCRMVRS